MPARHTVVAALLALFAAPAAAQTGDVARGEYLVAIGICEGCHTPRDARDAPVHVLRLAGGRRSGGLMTPNLTPDMETGLG